MHGIPSDLARHLDQFLGATLNEIGLGTWIIQFRFSTADNTRSPVIGVEGAWELRGPDSVIIDQNVEPAAREAYRVHVVLGRIVQSHEVTPPESFTLLFEGGYRLRVYDRSPQYESFSIQPGDVFV